MTTSVGWRGQSLRAEPREHAAAADQGSGQGDSDA